MAGTFYGPWSPAVYQAAGGQPIYNSAQSRPGQFNVATFRQPSLQPAGTRTYAPQSVPSPSPSGQVLGAATQLDPTAELDNGYNQYFAELDNQLNNILPGQRSAMESQVNNQAAISNNNLDLTNQQNTDQLNQYQGKSLKDISSSIANGFQAGNIFLGSRGAGDSTAANQYSYALTKMGTQQRSNVMSDVQNKAMAIKQVYDTAKQNLKLQTDSAIQGIAQWFGQQQQALAGLKGEALKEKSQQLYNYGLQQLAQIQQQAASRQSAIDSWIANNSGSLQGMISQMNAPMNNLFSPTPTGTGLSSGTPQAKTVAIGYGNNNEKDRLFG